MDIASQLLIQFIVAPIYNLFIAIDVLLAQNQLWLTCVIIGIVSAVAFLPAMIAGYFDQERTKDLDVKISAIKQEVSDPGKREKIILDLLRKKQIRFQSESVYLFGLAVILGLLYPIFTFHFHQLDQSIVYPFTPKPDSWNTNFLLMDLAVSSPTFTFIPSILLFFELRQSYQQQNFLTSFTDRWYPVILSLFVYFLIFWLPSALSLVLSVALLVSLYIRLMLSMFTAWRSRKG